MSHQIRKIISKELFFLVGVLIASNAYFVQRVIASVDTTTQEVISLREHVAKIEAEIEDLKGNLQAAWKRL